MVRSVHLFFMIFNVDLPMRYGNAREIGMRGKSSAEERGGAGRELVNEAGP